jgi:hypothetical protein
MKPGVLSAGLAAFFGVGTLLWLPLGAPAVQTLMEQTQAVGTAADLNSRAQSNGVNSLNRVKKVLGALQTLVEEAEKAQGEGANRPAAPAPAAPQAAPVSDVLRPNLLKAPEAPKQAKGRIFQMEGTILAVERIEGKTYYRLRPDQDLGLGQGDSLLVEVPRGEASEGAVGQRVRAFGAFSRLESSKKGAKLFAFVQGQMVSVIAPGAAAPQAPAAAPPTPQASAFAGPLGGWTLEGTVAGETGGTAVVTSPNGEPKFLSPGAVFGDGFRLVEVRQGEAVFTRGGEKLALSPW